MGGKGTCWVATSGERDESFILLVDVRVYFRDSNAFSFVSRAMGRLLKCFNSVAIVS